MYYQLSPFFRSPLQYPSAAFFVIMFFLLLKCSQKFCGEQKVSAGLSVDSCQVPFCTQNCQKVNFFVFDRHLAVPTVLIL